MKAINKRLTRLVLVALILFVVVACHASAEEETIRRGAVFAFVMHKDLRPKNDRKVTQRITSWLPEDVPSWL